MAGLITLFGQKKGGVGKSYTAFNTAGVIVGREETCCLVDADVNQTLFNAVGRRNAYSEELQESGHDPLPYIQCVVKKPEDTLTRELKQLAEMYDHVLVDTGGYENTAFKTAVPVADMVFLPFQPTVADYEQLAPTLKVIRDIESYVQAMNPDFLIDVRLLLTLVRHTDSDLFKEAVEVVQDLLPYSSIANSVIKYVKKVNQIQSMGLTLSDVKHTGRAQYEMLLDEINRLREPKYARQVTGSVEVTND